MDEEIKEPEVSASEPTETVNSEAVTSSEEVSEPIPEAEAPSQEAQSEVV